MYVDILIIIITFPYSTCIIYLLLVALFWQQHPYFFVIFKMFFLFLFMLFLCNPI